LIRASALAVALKFFMKTKAVTRRWPSEIKNGAEMVIPSDAIGDRRNSIEADV
jgi:hypothetical protein